MGVLNVERIVNLESGKDLKPRTWKDMGTYNVQRIGNLERGNKWEY